jgi:threonine synthase
MFYVSTRGYSEGQRFCDILLEGLAPDGGLYLPETYPSVDEAKLEHWRHIFRSEGYASLAFEILSL